MTPTERPGWSPGREHRSTAQRAMRAGMAIALLAPGVTLKLLGHVLDAAGVPHAHTVIEVGHWLLFAGGAVFVYVRLVHPWLRRRRRVLAARAARARLGAGGGDSGTLQLAFAPLVQARLIHSVATGSVAGDARDTTGFGPSPVPDERTVFEIGSLSKVFTGLLLADMAGRGEIALDEPIGRHLPSLPRDGAGAITPLQLATHRSGLPRLPRDLLLALLRDSFLSDRGAAPADPYADYDAERLMLALARARAPRAGTRFHYSNFAYAVLGHVLATVAARPYAELVAERICRPLGLHDTVVELSPELAGRMVEGHGAAGDPVPPWHTAAFAPAAGLHSTVADLLRFARAQLDPDTTPLAEAIRDSQRPRSPRGDRLGTQVALGWLVRSPQAGGAIWHNGGTGGFGSFLGFDPQHATAVVALSSSQHERALDEAGLQALADLAVAPPAGAPATREPAATR